MLADEQRTIMALEERAIELTAELGRLMAAPEPAGATREQRLWQLRVELDRTLVELKEAQARRLLLLRPLGMPPALGWLSRHQGDTLPGGQAGAVH